MFNFMKPNKSNNDGSEESSDGATQNNSKQEISNGVSSENWYFTSRASSVDTTGADDEDDDTDDELAILNQRHKVLFASQIMNQTVHPNSPSLSTSSTPQPKDEQTLVGDDQLDSFPDKLLQMTSTNQKQYHRPVPVLQKKPNHHTHKCGPPTLVIQHSPFNLGSHNARPLPSPQTPVQHKSLQIPTAHAFSPSSSNDELVRNCKSVNVSPCSATSCSTPSNSNASMLRSISDSTLRRAALHLNLNNQSVLPSFTSLQQFKKELSLTSASQGQQPSRRLSQTNRVHRKSMIATTSPTLPRCHSPIAAASLASPLDSPKVSPNQFALAAIKKVDGRRWSVASLPSSGYGTTPGSSNVSSQCSSQERLHQLHLAAAAAGGYHHPSMGHSQGHSSSTPVSAIRDDLKTMHKAFSSNESSQSFTEEDTIGRKSPSMRPRSRSLSSPVRAPLIDNEIVMMNTLYKERFPKATKQMEERLKNFITNHETLSAVNDIAPDSVAIVRFVHHQVLEMARDCLQKSKDKLITSRYFYEMSENLEKLLIQTREKSPEAASHLTALIKKLLLIVSRPARLLECLEFDPEEFYQLLEVAEGQARGVHGVQSNVPQYIISKLGLNRDPLAELKKDMSSLDNESSVRSPEPSQRCSSRLEDPQHSSTPKSAIKDHDDCNSSVISLNETTESCNSSDSASTTRKDNPSFSEPSESDFDTVKLISNGAYGAVYLVKHKLTRQRFALKKINKQNLILRNQVDQVFAERDIMSFTDNPFVVSMYCTFETKKHLCMVMEYVEGGDCANLLKNMGPFPPDMARFYFAETVLAVEYLHSFGIVHRDLKPDNLLINALGHIKLTDFGLSKMGLMSLATNLYEGYIDKETKQFSDKQVFGTPEYIAPEVILRQGYGKPVDWWSMGIILYEFLIGCVPFFGETPEELFAHTVNDDIEWPEEDDWPVPPEAKDIITALLQQNPLDRLGTAGSFELKEHYYFNGVDWNSLLRMKADFIPQLDDEEDTSYFDTRSDRYHHDLEEETPAAVEDDSQEQRSSAEDTDDNQSLFASFTSASPRYRKVTGSRDMHIEHRHSLSICESSHSDHSSDNSKMSLSPVLRRDSSKGSLSAQEISRFTANHLSCPDLDEMISKQQQQHPNSPHVSNQPQTFNIPNRAIEILDKNQYNSTPDSSQNESEDQSPLLHRRRRLHGQAASASNILPKFSFSTEEKVLDRKRPPALASAAKSLNSSLSSNSSTSSSGPRSLPVTPKLSVEPKTPSPLVISSPSLPTKNTSGGAKPKSRQIVKFSSASGLSLMIPAEDMALQSTSIQSPGGSSTASSRDVSPCRDLSPLINTLNAPIIVRRGPRGFGFTIRAIRVYFGDTDVYTVHHLVMEVDKGSPAFDAGLRPGDLVTHINGESVQGLFHTQVLQLLLSGGESVTLRATALETTSIKTGGRRRDPQAIKMAKRQIPKYRTKSRRDDKRRRTSLFRKLSSKKASAEMQQLAADRSISSQSAITNRHFNSPVSSSESSCAVGGSSSAGNADSCSSQSARPSSLHGLKHKLHVKTKTLHSPNRRKSVGHIPLSPLARTPSPSPVPISPTRSPSPLTIPAYHHHHHHHPAGSSNTTQTYSPGSSLTPTASFNRPKSAEPGSPLLLRQSQDRLHPQTAENKKGTAISPLCSPQCMVVTTSPKLSTTISSQTLTSRSEGSPNPTRMPWLSQATIHEEELEHCEEGKTNSNQESGARRKTEKSSSLIIQKEEKLCTSKSSNVATSSTVVVKSPKMSRQESLERTFQRITKVIRGSPKFESRSSKKNPRESSLSPSNSIKKSNDDDSINRPSVSKISRKNSDKKSAHEKRDIFRSLH